MSDRISNRRIWLVVLLISLGWGTLPIVIRVALEEGVGPLAVAAATSVVAAVAVVAFLAVTRRGVVIGRMEIRIGVVLSLLSVVLPNVLRPLALEHSGAGFFSLASALVPLVTVVIAHFVLASEPLKAVTLGGLVMGLAGVAVLVLSGNTGIGKEGNPVLAGLFALGSVVSVSASSVFAKRFSGRYSVMGVSGVQFAVGSVIVASLALGWEGVPPNPSLLGWGSLLYLGIFGTFMPVVLYYWLLQHVTVTYSTIIGYIIPFIAVVLGWLLLDEQIGWGILVGGALILIGVVITDLIRIRQARREASAAS
ncbi:MAG: DMT family transporter [Actinobacteria bacterium]|nr:DMT family transporter [Actinomycetota bacterium]MBU1492984.1 DMT family transporter [Actinomycetota bacterium]